MGFLFLIPLQVNANWALIRNADLEAQKTIRSVERRTAAVRTATSSTDLLELSRGLPPDWQPLPDASLDANRSRLLARVEPELARLRTTASANKSATIQKRLLDGLRDAMLCLIYAATFFGLRPIRHAVLPLELAGLAEPESVPLSGLGRAHTAGDSGPAPQSRADTHDPAGSDQAEPDLSETDRHPWYP